MIELLVIIILIIIFVIYTLFEKDNLTILTGVDGQNYWVRDLADKDIAIKTLVSLRIKLSNLLDYIQNKMNSIKINDPTSSYLLFEPNVKIMKERIAYVKIKETPSESKFTSYSINKGEELVFCIRSKADDTLHSINKIFYVATHELAHIGCPEVGHTDLFYKLNLFLLKEAIEFKLYNYTNYDQTPEEYCGISLNHSILN